MRKRMTKQLYKDFIELLFRKDEDYEENIVHKAAEKSNTKNLETIIKVVKRQKDKFLLEKTINTQSCFGKTPLHFAAENYYANSLKILLDVIKKDKKMFSKSISVLDHHGRTPTLQAVVYNTPKNISMFINTILKVDKDLFIKEMSRTDNKGYNILHLAAGGVNRETIQVLINLLKKETEIFKKLLSTKTDGNKNPIHLAAENENSEVLETLLDAIKEDKEMMETLLSEKNNCERTPLHIAVHFGYAHNIKIIVRVLQEYDPKLLKKLIKLKDSDKKDLLYFVAAYSDMYGFKTIFDAYFNAKNPEEYKKQAVKLLKEKDIYGDTILHRLARECTPERINRIFNMIEQDKKLIEELLNIKNNKGNTPKTLLEFFGKAQTITIS